MNKFDEQRHEHNLKEFDDKIAYHEAEIARHQTERREYINRHQLNEKAPRP